MIQELNAFQRDCLFVIARKQGQSGLEAKAELDRYYGRTINHRRLYLHLDTLVEKGLIEKEALDGRTNSYSITTNGISALTERRQWEDRMVRSVPPGVGFSLAGP